MPSLAFITPLALPHLSSPSATTTTRAPTVAALSHLASSSTLHLDWLPTQPLPSPTPSPAHTYITAPEPTLTPAQAAWSARIGALTAPVDNSPAAAETFPVGSDTSPVASNTSPAASRASASAAQPSAPTPVVPKAPPAPTAAQTTLSERVARIAPEVQAEVEPLAVVFSAKAVPAFAPAPKSVYEARMERMARIVAGEVEACEDVAEASDRWDRLGTYAARGVVQVKKAEKKGKESKSGGFIVKFQSPFWNKSGTKNIEEAAPVSSVAAPSRAAGDSPKGGREGWQASSARQALLKKDAASKVSAVAKVGAATGVAQAGASVDQGIVSRSRVVSAVTNEGDAVSGGGAMALDGGDVMESHNVKVALSSTILAVFLGVCLTVSERFSEIAHHAAESGMM